MKFRIITTSLLSLCMLAAGAPARADDPPTVTLTLTSALTGWQRVAFNETVRNVSGDNLFLRVHAEPAPLSAHLACLDASKATVDCATGAVRSVLVRGRAPLVPGQLYDLVVNPETAAAPIVDGGLNAAPKTIRTFRASVTEQETSVASRAEWRLLTSQQASGGSYRVESIRGALARFSFSGTGVTWFTRRGPAQGRASVSIDGKKSIIVNNYAAKDEYVKRSFTKYADGTPLADGRHYILIRVRGEKGNTAAKGTQIIVDGFRVNGVVTEEASRYTLPRKARTGASGGYVAYTNAPRASLEFTFWGRGVDWTTVTGPSMGKASMYIGTRLVKTVDNYSAQVRTGVRRSITGLAEGLHTLRIVVLLEKNARSSGRTIEWDRWQLRAPVTDFKGLGAWIDLWDYTASTTQEWIRSKIADMRARGVRTLYLQTGRYNTNGFQYPKQVEWWVHEAHAARIKAVGWFLPAYSEYLNSDVAKTVKIGLWRSSTGQRFDALAVDIEYRAKTSSRSEFMSGIADHLKRVRAQLGIVYPIAAITFAPLDMDIWPDGWEGFPWSTIARTSNVVMPMGYWTNRLKRCHGTGGFAKDTRYCAYQYTKENITRSRQYTGLPVHNIGGVAKYCSRYRDGKCVEQSYVTTSDTYAYVRATKEARGYGGGLYDYMTQSGKPALWEPLAGLNSL